jgi:hypothetical protein
VTALPVQSRTASLVEALVNVVIGFVLAVAIQRIAYPLFGIETCIPTAPSLSCSR